MKLLATLRCKRDAGYTDHFFVELYSNEKLKPEQVPFYIQAKRGFEMLETTDGKFVNLNNYYYYEVLSVEEVEE